jgi:two-component system cell cycle sensor histidine kinase PleC
MASVTRQKHRSGLGGWLVPIGAVVLLAFGQSWSAYDEYNQTLDNEFRLLTSNVRIASAQINVLLRDVAFNLNETIRDHRSDKLDDLAALDDVLASRLKEMDVGVRSLVYVNGMGLVEHSATPGLKNYDSSERDYFRVHQERRHGHGLYASRPYVTNFGDLSIACSIPDLAPDGSFRGVAVAGLSPNFFDEIIRNIVPEGNGNATLFNQYGDILNRQPGMEALIGTSGAGAPFKSHLQSGNPITQIVGVSIVDGVRRAIVFGNVAGTSLIVNAARPMTDVMSRWVQNSLYRALFVAICSAVILILAFQAIRRQRKSEIMTLALERSEATNRERTLFLASMSHEFRTPLNAIIGYSEGISLGTFGPVQNAKILEYIRDINQAGLHLLHLVEDVLDISSIELGKFNSNPEPVKIAELLASALTMTGPKAREKDLRIENRCDPAESVMIADRRRLLQVLTNLLGNAVKFTPDGGRISLTARELGDGQVLFEISDSGVGMDAEQLAVALTLFGQPDPNVARRTEGRGIGLPLSMYLVGAMGGTFSIDSQPGSGTRIQILMPSGLPRPQALAEQPS